MSSSPTSDPSPHAATLDAAADKENLTYISKFGLPSSVAQHIDSRLILNDVHINDPTTASDIELNSWVLNFLESYQLDSSLVVHMMLEVFQDEFHGWGYTEFSRLDRHIRGALKETFMAKGIYMGTPNGHVNQRLANLVIDEQLPIWDESELLEYKSMYPTSKAWVLLELRHSHPSRRITPSVEVDINPIDDRRQQTFTPRPAHIGSIPPMRRITPDPANALSSTPPTEAPLAQISLVQAPPTRKHPIQVPTAQVLPIQESPAQVLPIPAATVQAPLSVPLALSPPAEHGDGQSEMHPEQVKIVSDKIGTFTNKHADAQLSASGQKEIQGFLERGVFKVVTPNKVVTPEEVPSSTQVFDFRFLDDIKDPCTDKAYERSRSVIHAYNDEKENIVLGHSPKIPGFSQGLRDIMQVYVEIASDLYPDFYIRPLSELISQLIALFDSIVKVMRPRYGEPEVDNHRFAIYHPHYKEDNPANAVTKTSPNSALEGIISTNKGTIRLEGWVKR